MAMFDRLLRNVLIICCGITLVLYVLLPAVCISLVKVNVSLNGKLRDFD